MILVDTSVWIDFLTGAESRHRAILRSLIEAEEDLCLADIILCEILSGIRTDRSFRTVRDFLLAFPVYSLAAVDSYVAAAGLYRRCRRKGVTPRGISDCLIARIAIDNGLVLFQKDKDFERIADVIKDLKLLDIATPD